MGFENVKFLVAGAGFFGAVIAERIAADLGEPVVVIDRKGHTGGNSWSAADTETGIECHCYGSHIFHTADAEVWEYVNRFASFNGYRHRVLTRYGDAVYQMPINLATINAFYGRNMTPGQAQLLVREEAGRSGIVEPANLEEKAVVQIGRPLYDAFVLGYTRKQWETDPKELPAETIARLPMRFSYKSDYFNDPWQGIPLDGYHALFQRILDHPLIDLRLKTDFFAIREQLPPDCTVIFTGPVDRYFDYRFGRLGWRTLDFEKEVCPVGDFQGTSVMNYAEESVPFTRIHEFRHYHDERRYPADRTVIYREYSRGCGIADDPSYPINTAADRKMYASYAAAAGEERRLIVGGRLGSYSYLDMDKTIAAALATYRQRIAGRERTA